MIVLGKYVFKASAVAIKRGDANAQNNGYYHNVSKVHDHWRKDLDREYNPRHVPALTGQVIIEPYWVLLYGASQENDPPLVTWYNLSLNLPLPVDHGVADYEFRS